MFSSQNSQVSQDAVFVEDVFSTYLSPGTDAAKTITTGVDLATYGGLLWMRTRNVTDAHFLFDTARGATTGNCKFLRTDATSAQNTAYPNAVNVTTTGFSLLDNANEPGFINAIGYNDVFWTFREQPKFFDVVTFTAPSTPATSFSVPHSLGSTPGCCIIKRTDSAEDWFVYHRSLANPARNYLVLNSTAAAASQGSDAYAPTSTEVTLLTGASVSASGQYVMYLFAHNAGGFGLTGTDNVISCGSFTTDGSGNATVDLGYEPQWLVNKATNNPQNWIITDNMRGMFASAQPQCLFANTSGAEITATNLRITSTGFTITGYAANQTSIYIAIRRGPMKVPTTGTSVFAPVTYTGTNVDNRLVNTGIVTDMAFVRQRNSTTSAGMRVADRLRGNPYLSTGSTAAEVNDPDSFMTPTLGVGNSFSAMNGFGVGNDDTAQVNRNTVSHVAEAFSRAPGFFDEVCWSGSGTNVVSHNLTVPPELIIEKTRTLGNSFANWWVWRPNTGGDWGILNGTGAFNTGATLTATSTTFLPLVDGTGDTYVAYLFASAPGVSKVGSYTGTGTTQVINCGFTAGSRFVLIKRTDSTGDWYVWDSARGIVAGNDPYLLLNSTAAEVTNTDFIDTASTGFEISSTAPAAINASGGTFIFLAIA